MVFLPDVLGVAILSIFVFLALLAALVLVVVSLRTPANLPLLVAAGLVVLALVVVTVSPVNVPTLFGLILALLATALAVLGGDPLTRRVLTIATHGRVRDGSAGGILISDAGQDDASAAGGAAAYPPQGMHEVMRGGTTIGYLERISVVVAILAGFPEAIAVVVAVKGIGRFSELAAPEARERFIIGTMSSLLWACVVGALARLAIW
jgi:hypothetical protein